MSLIVVIPAEFVKFNYDVIYIGKNSFFKYR